MLGIKTAAPVVIPAPEFPHAIGHIWIWFCDIIRGLEGNGYSYPLITWEALAAWSHLMRQELAPREAQTLVKLGNLHTRIRSEKKPDGVKN